MRKWWIILVIVLASIPYMYVRSHLYKMNRIEPYSVMKYHLHEFREYKNRSDFYMDYYFLKRIHFVGIGIGAIFDTMMYFNDRM